MTYGELIFALYMWCCILFGFFYYYPKFKASDKVDDGLEWLCALIMGIIAVPWYWPLMVVWMIKDYRDKDRREMAEYQSRVRSGGRGISK